MNTITIGGQLRHGLRPHLVQAVDAVEGLLHRNRDQFLNFGGGESQTCRLDLDTAAAQTPGKTSTEALLSCAPPTIMRAAAIAMMIDRNLRLAATIRRMSVGRIEFSAEEFRGADGDDGGAGRGAGRGRDHSVLHLG